MTPTVHARKPKSQFPEAAGGSIWSAEGVTGRARDWRDRRRPTIEPASARHVHGLVRDWLWPRFDRGQATATACLWPWTFDGRGLSPDSVRTWICQGHGSIADWTRTRIDGGHCAAADCLRTRKVRGSGQFTVAAAVVDRTRPRTDCGLVADTDWPWSRPSAWISRRKFRVKAAPMRGHRIL